MNKKEFEKEMQRRDQERYFESLEANKNRAQALTVGSSGGGTTEITMRSNSGNFLWNVYQPVEVVEIIHQMAASIGCHIHIQPRNDFASWRQWKEPTDEERRHLMITHRL